MQKAPLVQGLIDYHGTGVARSLRDGNNEALSYIVKLEGCPQVDLSADVTTLGEKVKELIAFAQEIRTTAWYITGFDVVSEAAPPAMVRS